MNDHPKRGPGRPTLFTPEAAAKILQAVRMGLPFEKAAALGGVGSRTLRAWREKGANSPEGEALAEFEQEVEKAVAEGSVMHLARLDHASRGVRRNQETGQDEEFRGDATVSRWWLEWQHGKAEQRNRVDVTSDGKALPAAAVTFVVGRDVVQRVKAEDDLDAGTDEA